jgi:hypothetical protein
MTDMNDMRTQQLLDMIIEEGAARMGAERASRCMMISILYDVREQLRETTNNELAVQFGVRGKCPDGCGGCQKQGI